jgi:hypothetical protein
MLILLKGATTKQARGIIRIARAVGHHATSPPDSPRVFRYDSTVMTIPIGYVCNA